MSPEKGASSEHTLAPRRAIRLLLKKQVGQGLSFRRRVNIKHDRRNMVVPAQRRGGTTMPSVVKNRAPFQVEDKDRRKIRPKRNCALVSSHLAPSGISPPLALIQAVAHRALALAGQAPERPLVPGTAYELGQANAALVEKLPHPCPYYYRCPQYEAFVADGNSVGQIQSKLVKIEDLSRSARFLNLNNKIAQSLRIAEDRKL